FKSEPKIAIIDDPLEVRWMWVTGPATPSKRSIVSAWLQERGLAGHWHQFEGEDAQPVTILRHHPRGGQPSGSRAGVVAMLSEPPPGVVRVRITDEPSAASQRWGADGKPRERALAERAPRDEKNIVAHFLAVARAMGSVFVEDNPPAILDTWIEALGELLVTTQGVMPAEAELEVLRSARAVQYRAPHHRMLPALAERAERLARSLTNPDEKLLVASFALHYHAWVGEFARAAALSDDLAEIAIEASAPARLEFSAWRSTVLSHQADHDAAVAELKKAIDLARLSGAHAHEGLLQALLAETAIRAGNADLATRALDAAAPWLRGAPPSRSRHARFLNAGVLLLRDQADEAAHAAREVLRGQDPTARPPYLAATDALMFGQMLVVQGRHVEALESLSGVLTFARQMPSPVLQFQALLLLALSHFEVADREGGSAFLREAMALGARHNFKSFFPVGMAKGMTRLCARALEAGIEVPYVKRLIQRRGLKPESPDMDEWPWPVRIYTLGRFAVVLDGERLGFSRKAPKKPLELLKAILAKGGRGVDQRDLREQLWPDLDGDASRNALEMALRRLRRLLTSEDAIIVEDGTLALDPTQVWVDAWAFERLCGGIERMKTGALAKDELHGNANRLLRLYTGQFLAGEQLGWAFAGRERLRSKFVRAVGRLGQHFDRLGPDENAAALYRRAMELEPLAEELHHRLLGCYLAQNRWAEGLDAYRRFRDLLAVALGIQPAEPTRALYARLQSMSR
ncbi:MAG TPA: bacterial transcriptional activator domain-containing protein, partial [Polyangiaceae bacterium]